MEFFSYYIFWCIITGWGFRSSMSIDKRVNFTFMRAATLYQPWFKCRHLPRKSNCLGPGKLINWHFFHCHFAQSLSSCCFSRPWEQLQHSPLEHVEKCTANVHLRVCNLSWRCIHWNNSLHLHRKEGISYKIVLQKHLKLRPYVYNFIFANSL